MKDFAIKALVVVMIASLYGAFLGAVVVFMNRDYSPAGPSSVTTAVVPTPPQSPPCVVDGNCALNGSTEYAG